jgi:chromate reductase, NAD(P)H dehydrogenase (quinone)
MRTDPICILAISGSLRSASSNSVLLRVAASLAPKEIEISIYKGLGDLPHFNPDLDGDIPPSSVANFRRRLREADGVLISSPEYAHGVPGVLKNALDWLVRSGELVDKPVSIIDNLPRGAWALASLKEILTVLTASLSEESSFTLPLTTNNIDESVILSNPDLSLALRSGITRFSLAIRRRQDAPGGAGE